MSTVRLAAVGLPAPADLVIERLLALSTDLSAAATRVRAGEDRDAVHDLRVACRRLAAALELWRDGLDPDATRRARRRLRRLRRRLSRTREREVLVEQLGELLIGEPLAAREAGLDDRRRLQRRVKRDHARAAERARPGRIARVGREVEDATRTRLLELGPWRSAAGKRLEARVTAARATLRAANDGADDTQLHAARVAVKRWRYGVEALLAGGPDPRAESLTALRDLQRCLGEIHDAAVLRDRMARRAARKPSDGRPRAAGFEMLRRKADQARQRALERLSEAIARLDGASPAA